MNGIEQMIAFVLAIWFMGLGFAIMVQAHGRFVHATTNAIRSVVLMPFRYIWQNHRTRVVWFAVGFISAVYLRSFYGVP